MVYGKMDSTGYCSAVFGGRQGRVPLSFIQEMDLTDPSAKERLVNQSLTQPNISVGKLGEGISQVSLRNGSQTQEMMQLPVKGGSCSACSTYWSGLTWLVFSSAFPNAVSKLHTEMTENGVIVKWRPPATNEQGCSNGVQVTGYTVLCDGLPLEEVTSPSVNKV